MILCIVCEIVTACVALSCVGSVVADMLNGRVAEVADGDSLTVLDASFQHLRAYER